LQVQKALQPVDPHRQIANLLQQLVEVLLRDLQDGPRKCRA
jgi:hypothetical protein